MFERLVMGARAGASAVGVRYWKHEFELQCRKRTSPDTAPTTWERLPVSPYDGETTNIGRVLRPTLWVQKRWAMAPGNPNPLGEFRGCANECDSQFKAVLLPRMADQLVAEAQPAAQQQPQPEALVHHIQGQEATVEKPPKKLPPLKPLSLQKDKLSLDEDIRGE